MDKIDADCPECGKKLKVSVDDIARQRTVRCAGGHSVKLVDEGGGARKVSNALSDLENRIKKLGK